MRFKNTFIFKLVLLLALSMWSLQATGHIHDSDSPHDNSCELSFVLENGEETLDTAQTITIEIVSACFCHVCITSTFTPKATLSYAPRAPPVTHA